jgi:predicted RNA-binding Zn ribbon-like protein
VVAKRQDAPGRLELVRGFVNSHDLERGTDDFVTSAGLRDWLRTAGLAAEEVTETDRARAVELREAVRAFVHGGPPTVLNEAAREAGVTLVFDAEGKPALRSAAGGATAAFGELVAIIATAHADGTWQRMRVCPNPDCRWMFYDHSKNRSGRWCQMAECGNRAKVRAYRERPRERRP